MAVNLLSTNPQPLSRHKSGKEKWNTLAEEVGTEEGPEPAAHST